MNTQQQLIKPVGETEPDNLSPSTVSVFNEQLASARLEALKKQNFTPECRPERIANALAALYQPATIQLSAEEWRRIAEDPDLADI